MMWFDALKLWEAWNDPELIWDHSFSSFFRKILSHKSNVERSFHPPKNNRSEHWWCQSKLKSHKEWSKKICGAKPFHRFWENSILRVLVFWLEFLWWPVHELSWLRLRKRTMKWKKNGKLKKKALTKYLIVNLYWLLALALASE